MISSTVNDNYIENRILMDLRQISQALKNEFRAPSPSQWRIGKYCKRFHHFGFRCCGRSVQAWSLRSKLELCAKYGCAVSRKKKNANRRKVATERKLLSKKGKKIPFRIVYGEAGTNDRVLLPRLILAQSVRGVRCDPTNVGIRALAMQYVSCEATQQLPND